MSAIIQLPRAGMAGEYRIKARKADGSGRERLLADWFSNNITEVGLEGVINPAWKQYCQVGTGIIPAADTDTALAAPVLSTAAISNITQSSLGSSPYYSQASCDYTFPVGAGTYTEVGVASGPHDGSFVMFSRALIVDSLGDPTAITVLADEFLVVTYRLRMYPNLTDEVGLIGVGADTHEYTIRAINVNNANLWQDSLQGGGESFKFSAAGGAFRTQGYSGGIVSITSTNPTGTSLFTKFTTEKPYIPGSYQFLTDAIVGFSDGNSAGHIGALVIFVLTSTGGRTVGWGTYQIGFDPVIPKDSSIQLTFTVGMGWGRYVAP